MVSDIMSLVELIDGGSCEIQPQRCQPSGISDGDPRGFTVVKSNQANLGTRGLGGDSIGPSVVQFTAAPRLA